MIHATEVPLENLERKPKVELFIAGLLAVALLAVFDFVFDRELSLLALYLAPVLFTAWFVGRRASYLITIASASAWIADEILGGHAYTHFAIPYWNLLARVLILLAFGWTAATFREAVEREKAAEKKRVRRELEIAKEVQSLLLPRAAPKLETLALAQVCTPAREVGGDYYDFIPVPPYGIGIVVADVSGKGVGAALLMARLQGLMRTHAPAFGTRLGELAHEMNLALHLPAGGNQYVTAFIGLYDDRTGALLYVNCGHVPPLVVRRPTNGRGVDDADSTVEWLETGGRVLGLLENAGYEVGSVEVDADDILVIYTDGVSENANPKDEQFGRQALASLVTANRHLPPAGLRDLILQDLERFRSGEPLADDLTLIVGKGTEPHRTRHYHNHTNHRAKRAGDR